METFFLLLRCSCYSFIVSFAVTVTEMDFHWISNLRRRRKVVGKIEKRAKYDISTLAISLDRDLGLFPYTMRTFLIAHTSLRKVSAEKKIKHFDTADEEMRTCLMKTESRRMEIRNLKKTLLFFVSIK